MREGALTVIAATSFCGQRLTKFLLKVRGCLALQVHEACYVGCFSLLDYKDASMEATWWGLLPYPLYIPKQNRSGL